MGGREVLGLAGRPGMGRAGAGPAGRVPGAVVPAVPPQTSCEGLGRCAEAISRGHSPWRADDRRWRDAGLPLLGAPRRSLRCRELRALLCHDVSGFLASLAGCRHCAARSELHLVATCPHLAAPPSHAGACTLHTGYNQRPAARRSWGAASLVVVEVQAPPRRLSRLAPLEHVLAFARCAAAVRPL